MRALGLLLLLALPLVGRAQIGSGDRAAAPPDFVISTAHIDVRDGLPDRRVTGLAQDRSGFIWLSTLQGLARFDGQEFLVLTSDDGLASDEIVRVKTDAHGQLWVGHRSGALDIVDPRTLRVVTYPAYAQGATVAGQRFDLFTRSPRGDILISVGNDLRFHNGGGRAWAKWSVDLPTPPEPFTMGSAGESFCAYRVEGDVRVALVIPPASGKEGSATVIRSQLPATGMARGEDHLPGATPIAGHYLLEMDGSCLRSYWLDAAGTRTPFDAPGHCRPLTDSWSAFSMPVNEDLWMLGTRLVRLKAGEPPLNAPVIFDLLQDHPEIEGRVNDMLRDRLGNMWLATDFGLYRINVRRDHFKRLLADSAVVTGYGRRVRGLVLLPDGLHVNTEYEGYHVVEVGTGKVLRSEPPGVNRVAMAPALRGGLWRGANGDALREAPDGTIVQVIRSAGDGCYAWSLLDLGPDGLLLGCTAGLRRWTSGDTAARVMDAAHPELAMSTIWHLGTDRSGRILACTSKGLFALERNGTVRDRWWTKASDPARRLPADDIRHFLHDASGVYWLSTATRGLIRWDPATDQVRVMGREIGLPRTSIHAAYQAADGSLWLPTDHGLFRYDPRSDDVRKFTVADGLPSDEFNRVAHTQGPDGTLYFGGLNGVVAFEPADVLPGTGTHRAPLVVLQAIVQQRNTVTDVTQAAVTGAPIHIRPGDAFVQVDLALLSYQDPTQLRYAWRIPGIYDGWNIQRDRSIRLASLPFGEHPLEVRTIDAERTWSAEPLTILLVVHRPLHLQAWFLITCVLCLAAIITLAVRYRLRQMRRLITMRDRIAMDLHDEVGSSLSGIVLFSSAVRKHARPLPDKAAGMLDRIAENSMRAMESMNDIVWTVNSRHDQLSDLLDRMRAYAEPMGEAAGITVVFDVTERLVDRKLGMEERKSLYLVFKEAFNNAVKHARCRCITVTVRPANDRIELIIEDDGVGLTRSAGPAGDLGGNGMGNMHRRAEHCGGQLFLEARAGGGTRVVVRMPTGR